MKHRRLAEAASFVPIDLRRALEGDPGAALAGVPSERVLLSCDVSGFSRLSNALLEADENGVEALHRLLDLHFRKLLDLVAAHGGRPLFFFGDALLSVWDADADDPARAPLAAVAAGLALAEARRAGDLPLDLNLHVSSGSLRLVDAGGHNDQRHLASVGSAMRELRGIGALRATNCVIASRSVLEACGPGPRVRWLDAEAAVVEALEGARQQGPDLREPPRNEKIEDLLARTPKSVRRWLTTLGLQWVAELRPVTAVIIALRGFDEAAADAPERLDALVRRIQECLHARDGSIDCVMIDDKGAAVLGLFGVPPDAHSDDPLRGVLAAADLREALAEMGQDAACSVSTGRAFCAVVGNEKLRTYMVVGDVVTRASRLCMAMGPDETILVDDATMRMTQSVVRYAEAPAMMTLRGFDAPVQAWRLAGGEVRAVQEFRVSGRDAELARLRTLWDAAREGPASVGVVIEGEAGAGKTTLAMALRDQVVRDGGLFLSTGAVSVDAEIPFRVLRRLTMEALGVSPAMSLDARRRTLLERLPPDLADHAPLLGAIFRTGLDDTPATRLLGGAARAEALEELLLALYARAFGAARVCLCFEDAHWLDARTQGFLGRLLGTAPGLMVVVLRQGAASNEIPEGLEGAGFEMIRIGSLDDRGLEALILARLGCLSVDSELMSRLAATSGGYPFFVTELLQSLQDEGQILIEDGRARLVGRAADDAIRFPATLYGAVLQRLDRVEPEPQFSLRVAAVPGLTFPLRLAIEVHPLAPSSAEAVVHFDEHVRRGFLDPRMIDGDQGFGFRHGIVREVAYSQLPTDLRRSLHRKVAEWLELRDEALIAGRRAELAHHWAEAGEAGRAVACLADEAARVFGEGFANQAVALGLRAVALTGLEVPADEDAMRAGIGANMAAIQGLAGGRDPTALALGLGEPSPASGLKLTALLSTAPFAFQSNRFELFAWLASTSVRLALEDGGGGPHEFSLFSVIVSAMTGDRAAGAEWSRAALELDARRGGAALPAVGFLDTWFHAHWRDPIDRSPETNRAAARRALETGDIQYASYNIAGEVVMIAAGGRPLPEVIEAGRAALEHPLVRNSEMQVHLEIQFARALRGETDHPRSLTSPGVDEAGKIGWVVGTEFVNQIGYYLAGRVKLERHAGAWAAALETAAKAAPARPAIAGQTAEIDLVFHAALARIALMLADPEARDAQRAALQSELDALSLWKSVHPGNFAAKADIAAAAREGVEGDRRAAAEALAAISAGMGTDRHLQDRALALEYAARLDPTPARVRAAAQACRDWGATALAIRLEAELG